jgi:uncharacterized SAM-binding protein YcdF (DUF218 family)
MATDSIATLTTPAAPTTIMRHKTLWRRRALTAVIVIMIVWPALAWAGARWLIVKSELSSADAIVVLSGSATYVERANYAAKLYGEGRAPIVIVTDDGLLSGWSQTEERNPSFYELASRELQSHGVPRSQIVIVSDIGAGTYQECARIADYARRHQMNRLILVTSAYHTRRALWAIRHAGPNAQVGIDSPPPGWQTPTPAAWWLSRWGWRVVAAEYVKMVYYRFEY